MGGMVWNVLNSNKIVCFWLEEKVTKNKPNKKQHKKKTPNQKPKSKQKNHNQKANRKNPKPTRPKTKVKESMSWQMWLRLQYRFSSPKSWSGSTLNFCPVFQYLLSWGRNCQWDVMSLAFNICVVVLKICMLL